MSWLIAPLALYCWSHTACAHTGVNQLPSVSLFCSVSVIVANKNHKAVFFFFNWMFEILNKMAQQQKWNVNPALVTPIGIWTLESMPKWQRNRLNLTLPWWRKLSFEKPKSKWQKNKQNQTLPWLQDKFDLERQKNKWNQTLRWWRELGLGNPKLQSETIVNMTKEQSKPTPALVARKLPF